MKKKEKRLKDVNIATSQLFCGPVSFPLHHSLAYLRSFFACFFFFFHIMRINGQNVDSLIVIYWLNDFSSRHSWRKKRRRSKRGAHSAACKILFKHAIAVLYLAVQITFNDKRTFFFASLLIVLLWWYTNYNLFSFFFWCQRTLTCNTCKGL